MNQVISGSTRKAAAPALAGFTGAFRCSELEVEGIDEQLGGIRPCAA